MLTSESEKHKTLALVAAAKAQNSMAVHSFRSVSQLELRRRDDEIRVLRSSVAQLETQIVDKQKFIEVQNQKHRAEVEELNAQLRLYKKVDVYSVTLSRALKG